MYLKVGVLLSFKVGDVVTPKSGLEGYVNGRLELGGYYTVVYVDKYDDVMLKGIHWLFSHKRFELVESCVSKGRCPICL